MAANAESSSKKERAPRPLITSDAGIRSLKPGAKPEVGRVGKGLCVWVMPSGAKLWRYRYKIGGKENMFAMGEYVTPPRGESEEARAIRIAGGRLTLAEATAECARLRALVKQGVHPSHNRASRRREQTSANANTFKAVAEAWIASRKPRWTPYYCHQVERFLETDAYGYFGDLPIKAVTARHLLDCIKRVEARGAETVAILLRQWFSAIFRFAVANLMAEYDPASALKGAVERPPVKHKKPLSRKEVPAFVDALEAYGGYLETKAALRLVMLTFVRTKEVRHAEWSEIDLDAAEWRIPAEKMKKRDAHIVPLSTQAVALLRELQKVTGGQKYLFPNHRRLGDCMSGTTLNRALERMGYAGRFSAHAFRTTASTMLNELAFRPDVIERQLAHKERNQTRAAYNRAEYLEERRAMMQSWANLIDEMAKRESNVAPINQGAAA